MKIKINDTIYDSEETAMMLILTENDKFNIRHMPTDNLKYACFPDTEKRLWMTRV